MSRVSALQAVLYLSTAFSGWRGFFWLSNITANVQDYVQIKWQYYVRERVLEFCFGSAGRWLAGYLQFELNHKVDSND